MIHETEANPLTIPSILLTSNDFTWLIEIDTNFSRNNSQTQSQPHTNPLLNELTIQHMANLCIYEYDKNGDRK